jgi:hemolysin III
MKRLHVNFLIKEPFSALSHAVGIGLAIAALVLLVVWGSLYGTVGHIVGFAIFGAGAILLYTASTLYHWLPLRKRGEMIWQRLDHSAIFIMIAGSYTPICLVVLQPAWGMVLLSVVWLLATLGIVLCWLPSRKRFHRWWSSTIYLGMGWLSLVAIYPLFKALPGGAFAWLVGGGVSYSIGAVIYGMKWPNPIPKVFGFHEIFHLFVLLGSFCHFWMLFYYVVELRPPA